MRRPTYRGAAAARGFTMMELLAVMVMIGIMAALASPSFIAVLRDRRVNRSAQSIAEVYRMARARALGRGAAVMIRWNKTGGSGSKPIFETYEAVVAAADAQPVSSCLTGFGAAGFTRRVNTLQPEGGLAELATVKLFDGGVERANADICFSPRGRTFVRWSNTNSDGFLPMTGVPHVEVTNTKTSLLRTVFVPPNGVARLML